MLNFYFIYLLFIVKDYLGKKSWFKKFTHTSLKKSNHKTNPLLTRQSSDNFSNTKRRDREQMKKGREKMASI